MEPPEKGPHMHLQYKHPRKLWGPAARDPQPNSNLLRSWKRNPSCGELGREKVFGASCFWGASLGSQHPSQAQQQSPPLTAHWAAQLEPYFRRYEQSSTTALTTTASKSTTTGAPTAQQFLKFVFEPPARNPTQKCFEQ